MARSKSPSIVIALAPYDDDAFDSGSHRLHVKPAIRPCLALLDSQSSLIDDEDFRIGDRRATFEVLDEAADSPASIEADDDLIAAGLDAHLAAIGVALGFDCQSVIPSVEGIETESSVAIAAAAKRFENAGHPLWKWEKRDPGVGDRRIGRDRARVRGESEPLRA